LAQLEPALGDKAANVAAAVRAIRAAADRDAELVLFPELFLTGYFTRARTAELAEPPDGPSIAAVRACSREHRVMTVIGFPERDPRSGLTYDSVCLISRDGAVSGCYRKTHLYGDESRYFAAGDVCEPVDIGVCRAGLMICFDVEFPEVARILAIRAATLLLVSSANMTPFETYQEVYLRARALENHCFCALVNRVGTEEDTRFFGRSAVSDPFGRLVCLASDREELLVVDLDLSQTSHAQGPLRYLESRRPGLYGAIVQETVAASQ